MPKIIKITIIGNSVALRVRPPEIIAYSQNKVYGTLLEEKTIDEKKIEVINLARSRYLTSEFKFEKDIFIRTFPNYFIINLGSVDAPSREIPLWFSDILFMRNFRSLHKLISFIYARIIRRFLRKILVLISFKSSWVSEKSFQINMNTLINSLLKETSASLIVLGINAGNKRIEKGLPGTMAKYLKYNQILEELPLNKKRIHFVDVSHLESDSFFPDGVHYNHRGHKYIANELLQIINLEEKN